jgi:hypothetical protein
VWEDLQKQGKNSRKFLSKAIQGREMKIHLNGGRLEDYGIPMESQAVLDERSGDDSSSKGIRAGLDVQTRQYRAITKVSLSRLYYP